MTDPSYVDVNLFAGLSCRDCGATRLRLEYRVELVARSLSSCSLAGVQPKVAAVERSWPWCVCDACGGECRGRLPEEDT